MYPRLLLPHHQPCAALGSTSGCRGEFDRRPSFAHSGGIARQRRVRRGGKLWCASEAAAALGWPDSSPVSDSRRACSTGATTTLTSSPSAGEADKKVPTMAAIWEKIRPGEESVLEEGRLRIRVPSVQHRCARAGGSLFSQRNGWTNQELLPVLTSALGPRPDADPPTPSPLISDGCGIESQLPSTIAPPKELRRLQRIGLPLKPHFKIGRPGVTDGVLQLMHNVWSNSEVVKIRCNGPAADNMRQVVEDIERKSGGSVIWSAGAVIVAYRGEDFVAGRKPVQVLSPEQAQVARILERLGPRYDCWQGAQPAPLDGDKLEGLAPLYRKPLRLLPCACKAALNSNEQTIMRRAANLLPPHVVLGSPERLEGVAYAVIQLWEKCEVVNVKTKENLLHGNLFQMSEELQRLTGGVIIAKHKDCLLLYRGNDFPPPPVAAALEIRRATLHADNLSFRVS